MNTRHELHESSRMGASRTGLWEKGKRGKGERLLCSPALLLLFACAFLLLAPPAKAQAKMQQFSVVNTSTTVPKQLTNTVTYCTSFTLEGKASAQGSANAGTLYLGPFSTDGLNGYPITSGGLYVYSDPKGRTIDLSTFYIDVTSANDGVCVTYW